jgi:hypothetical protein
VHDNLCSRQYMNNYNPMLRSYKSAGMNTTKLMVLLISCIQKLIARTLPESCFVDQIIQFQPLRFKHRRYLSFIVSTNIYVLGLGLSIAVFFCYEPRRENLWRHRQSSLCPPKVSEQDIRMKMSGQEIRRNRDLMYQLSCTLHSLRGKIHDGVYEYHRSNVKTAYTFLFGLCFIVQRALERALGLWSSFLLDLRADGSQSTCLLVACHFHLGPLLFSTKDLLLERLSVLEFDLLSLLELRGQLTMYRKESRPYQCQE